VGCIAVALLLRRGDAAPRSSQAGRRIVIGSKSFTENRLLGEIMAQLIEAQTDIRVERRVNLGGTTVVFTALRSGKIDIYPEYTGTAWTVELGNPRAASGSLRVYLYVADEFARRYDLTWLRPFGFNNSYALAMDATRADQLGVRSISDLRQHEDRLRFSFTHEFLDRPDGYPGLAKAYGLKTRQLRGIEHGLAYAAIRTGRTDIIDTYTTDGKLLRYDIRVLLDDQQFFPPYDAAPVVRTSTLEQYPELRRVLNRLAFRIDDATMRKLNYQVEERGGSFKEVARAFLRANGFVGSGKPPEQVVATPAEKEGFFPFFWGRRAETVDLVGEHLELTAIAVALAIVFALPLGVLLTRKALLVPPVMGGAGVIQTIPSLALLAFMIPVPGLGLGARSAIAALFLYALLPIVRNTYAGIKQVNPLLIETARGMGLSDRQILLRVELPLATRTIMAGIRTATVISIGVATLAAFIGAGGLGDPIVTGLQLNDTNMILSGAVPAALLALVVDGLLGLAERVLVPGGIR